jgi:predicted metalloprotease with PDZ domain
MSSKLLGVRAILALPFLLMLSADIAVGADLLRYTVRFDPFEVELTLPNGAKQTESLPRQPTYFSHRANLRWPVPEGPADKPVRCEIRWVGFPADWRLVSSWSIDRREESVETTLRGLRKAVFAGGDFRTAKSKSGLVLVTRGKWPFSDASMLDLMDRVAEFHTAVWRDHGAPGHKVFLVPSTRSWEGEGRTKALIMEGNPDTYDAGNFSRLLSHELFHEWNPRRLNTDDEELYWFTEGFTDHFAVATLWRSGIWNFEQVIQDFNRISRTYFTSSARNLTPGGMTELRQSNFPANRLPYQQGYLLAAHWNVSGNSLDLVMRNLLKDNRKPLSNARIVKALRAIGIGKAEEEIRRFVVEGETIELRANLWGACATETKTEFRTFDMGFDWTISNRTKIIHGAKLDSNAWQAGVRDGQKWTAIDVDLGDSTYLAEIEIEDEQGRRHIKYYPASVDVAVAPQYKASAPQCDPGRLTPRSAAR